MRLGVFDLNSSSPPLPLPFLEEEKKKLLSGSPALLVGTR